MSYKSVQTIVTDPNVTWSGLDAALTTAQKAEAHLDVLCIGVDRTPTAHLYAGANALIQQDARQEAERLSVELTTAVEQRLAGETVLWSCDAHAIHLPLLNKFVASRARFADLVVLPQPYGEGRSVDFEVVTEAALFDGQVPIIVCPDDETVRDFDTVVIGWNESPEALTAIRAALPLLKAAKRVDIAIIDPPTHSPDRSDPGGMLSTMLARHGVNAGISVLAKPLPRVSDVMLRHLADVNADLLVMGAYGHSRFRESILGGATRDMLEHMTTPVFMAH